MKNIGIITPYHNNFGGGEVYIKEVNEFINKQDGYESYIMTSDLEVFKEDRKIEIPQINSYKKIVKELKVILNILKNNNIEYVILNDYYLGQFALIFKINGYKVISLIHGEISYITKVKNEIVKKIIINLRKFMINIGSYKILSVNNVNLKYFSRKKASFIGNFIDDKIALQEHIEKEYDFVFCGRLTKLKRVQKMIKIFSEYHKVNGSSKMLIIGDGEESESIRNYISNLQLSNSINMVGSKCREEAVIYMKKAKVLLLFSETEGFPTVILEALINGIPCIVTNVGSNSKIIVNNKNGYLIDDIEDEEKIAKIMWEICNSYYFLANNCINSIEEYKKEKVLDKFLKEIEHGD